MPLPSLIAIEPLPGSIQATITVPGSKSITNRALILAALAGGATILRGALWSEDTQVMVDCLRKLGFEIEIAHEKAEPANRSIRVMGLGGRIPGGGTVTAPMELFVGNAGTAARFLAAFVCLGPGVYRLHGVNRMHERPQAELFTALRGLGYRIDAASDRLPAVIYGAGGPQPGKCRVSMNKSSQFASALLLTAPAAGWEIGTDGVADFDEAPYVAMTARLVSVFPASGGEFDIEPDASGGSYFWAAGAITKSQVQVRGWPTSGWQIDAEFPRFLPLPGEISRERHLGDSIMTAITIGPLAEDTVRFTDLGRLRMQECERVVALRTELTKCGARIEERGDTLIIDPSTLHGADIETYHDHRMAMCFATLALRLPGIRLHNPACVKKTFPNFFQKLAAPAPDGLGAVIRDGFTHQILEFNDLFAT